MYTHTYPGNLMKFSIVKKWRCSSFIFQNTFAQEPAKVEFRDIHFEIPALCRRHYSWSISLCIVSEYSADGRELLHGEKGGKERETLYGPQVSTVIRLFLIAVIFKKKKEKTCATQFMQSGEEHKRIERESKRFPNPISIRKNKKNIYTTPCANLGKKKDDFFYFLLPAAQSLTWFGIVMFYPIAPEFSISFFLSFYAAFNIIKTLQIDPTKKKRERRVVRQL